MRNMNCRNIRREIEEAGSTHLLSADTIAHLESCAACETLSRQQNNLHAIISSLGTVEAPSDFDFRLRARIAGEKRGEMRFFPLRGLTFSLRFAGVAAIFLIIGSAFVVVSLRGRTDNPVATAGKQITTQPGSTTKIAERQGGVSASSTEVASGPKTDELGAINPSDRLASKRGGARRELASLRGGSRLGTRDLSSTQAEVLKRYPQLAEAYPTAAFPINASYQSLKVSVDDGTGISRTISLPTVSFGSQRALSQNASPLMASARGTW